MENERREEEREEKGGKYRCHSLKMLNAPNHPEGGKGRERGENKGEKELLPHLLVPTGLRKIGREMDIRKR